MEPTDRIRAIDKWKRSFASTRSFVFNNSKGMPVSIKFTDVCTHKADDLFDVLLKLYVYLEQVKQDTRLLDTMFVSLAADPVDEISTAQLSGCLESVLKAQFYVLYHDAAPVEVTPQVRIDPWTGCEACYKGMTSMTPFEILSGYFPPVFRSNLNYSLLPEIRKVCFPDVNGRRPFPQNGLFMDILTYVRKVRNNQTHPDDSKEEWNLIDDDNCKYITKVCILSYLLLIDFHYDTFREKMQRLKQTDAPVPIDTEAEAAHYFASELPGSIVLQERWILEKVFNRFCTGNMYRSTAAIPLQLTPFEARTDNDEEENEEYKEAVYDPFSFISEEEKRYYVILGDPGAGKSTMLAQLISRFGEEWKENPRSEDNLLPLRINLCYLDNESRNIREYIKKALFCIQDVASDQLRQSIADHLEALMKQGRVVFFFDGINEIPADSGNMLEKIFSFMQQYPQCKLVFSSRIKEFGEVAPLFRADDLFRICEPTDQQILAHIRHVVEVIDRNRPASDTEPDDPAAEQQRNARIEHLYGCIEDDENLRNLSRNPLHLSMIIDLLVQSTVEQSEYNNRGILYQTFVNRLLKSVENAPGLLSADLIRILLMDFAWLRLETAGRTKTKFIDYYCRYKSYLGLDADRLSKTLDKLCSVNLLTAGNDQVIRFSHDSYNEYFRAVTFVEKYTDPAEKATLLHDFDPASTAHIEVVKMALELMEQKPNGPALTFELARHILSTGSDGLSNGKLQKDDAGRLVLRIDRKPAFNRHLHTLIQLTGGLSTARTGKLKESGSPDFRYYSAGRNAYYLVEDLVQNIFNISEQFSFDLDAEEDRNYLTGLFELAGRVGTYASLKLLFKPVWRQYWLMLPEEFERYAAFCGTDHKMDTHDWYAGGGTDRFSRKKVGVFINQLPNTIRTACSNYEILFHLLDEQFTHAECLVIPLQLSNIGKFTRALLLHLSLEKPKELRALYKKFNRVKQPSTFIRHYRNIAVLLTSDPEFIARNFERNIPELVINGMVLTHLLSMYESPVMQKFLFEPEIFQSISSKGKVFRYFIYRGYFLPDLMQLIVEQYFRLKGSERKELEDILDLLPMEKIPKEILQDRDHYDLDIYQSIKEAADKEDTVPGGIGYQIVYVLDDRVGIRIPDMLIPETCRYALMPYDAETARRHRILSHATVFAKLMRVKIRNEEGTLLPVRGTLTFPGETDEAAPLEYVSSKSTNDGLYLELADKLQQRRIKTAYKNGCSVRVEGETCSIAEEPQISGIQRMKIVEIEKDKNEWPAFRGDLLFYREENDDKPIAVNQALQTPLLMQEGLFRQASCDPAEDPHFSLLGYDNQSRMLATEQLADDVVGLYCQLSGSGSRYYISDYSPALKGYFELTFEADFQNKLPLYGSIEWTGTENPPVPYCFVRQCNNKYLLRVNDWEAIVKLKNPAFVDKMFAAASFTVGRLNLHLEAVEWVEGSDRLAVVSLLPVSRKSQETPSDGCIRFYRDPATETPVQVALKTNSRNRIAVVPSACFGCDARMQPLAVVPKKVQIHTNQYIFLRGRELRYRVLTAGTNFEAGARFVLKPKSGDFPPFGHLIVPAWQGEALAFHAQPPTGKGNVSIMVFTARKELITAETLPEILSIGHCLIRETDTVVEIEGVSNVQLLEGPFNTYRFQKEDTFALPAGNDLEIQNYWPVVNRFDKVLFNPPAAIHFYQTDHVTYVSNERRLSILIPRPVTNIRSLYLRIDDRVFTCETTEISPAVQSNFDGESFLALQLTEANENAPAEDEAPGYPRSIPSSGTVFFYRDAASEKPAKVGFDLLSHLIESASPHKYHASICSYLLEENERVDQLSEGWVDFFRQRNSTYLLIDYIRQHAGFAAELQAKQIRLPILQVLWSDTNQISLYAPDTDKLLVSTDCTKLYETNTLVCMENNYKLTRVDDAPQTSLFQFLKGVVIKNRPQCSDCWIRCNTKRNGKWLRDDFYYHYQYSDYRPQEGDWMCFFPGRNIRNTFEKTALRVSYECSLVRKGIVRSVRANTYYTDGTLEFQISDLEDSVWKDVFINVHPQQTDVWNRVTDLQPGDLCDYYRESNHPNNRAGHFYFSKENDHV